MITDLQKINEEEMLKNWALAEVDSVRRQKYLSGILPESLIQKISQEQYEFTQDEWQILIKMIKSTRSQLLNDLLKLDVEWYEGIILISICHSSCVNSYCS